MPIWVDKRVPKRDIIPAMSSEAVTSKAHKLARTPLGGGEGRGKGD